MQTFSGWDVPARLKSNSTLPVCQVDHSGSRQHRRQPEALPAVSVSIAALPGHALKLNTAGEVLALALFMPPHVDADRVMTACESASGEVGRLVLRPDFQLAGSGKRAMDERAGQAINRNALAT